MQAGGFSDYLIPVSSDLEPEEDEFYLGPIGALRESAATRLCYIRPKWPELLKRSASNTEGTTSSFLYRSACLAAAMLDLQTSLSVSHEELSFFKLLSECLFMLLACLHQIL